MDVFIYLFLNMNYGKLDSIQCRRVLNEIKLTYLLVSQKQIRSEVRYQIWRIK